MAKPKRYGEVAVKNRAHPHDPHADAVQHTIAALDLADGDTAWNPHGDDFAGPVRVIYQFHENGDPPGVMLMEDVPPFM